MRSRIRFTLIPILFATCTLLTAQSGGPDKTALTLTALFQGQPVSATLNITAPTANTAYSVFVNSPGATPWLKLNGNQIAVNGTTNGNVTVSADPAGLQPGKYTGSLNVFVGTSSTPTVVTVTFQVSTIGVNPSAITFSPYVVGTSSVPGSQSVTLTGTAAHFTATASVTGNDPQWFSIIPTSGDIPGAITATINSGALGTLSTGTHTGNITVTPVGSTDVTPVNIPVTLVVTAAPTVSVNPTSLTFYVQNPQNGGTNNKTSKSFTLNVNPIQSLNFAFSASTDSGGNWIVCCTVVPASQSTDPATGKATVTVSVSSTGLTPGTTYTGKINLSIAGGAPSTLQVPVTLVYSNNQLLDVPSDTLNFTYQLGGAKPATQNVNITSTSGTLAYTFSTTSVPAGWLSAVSTLGSSVVPPNGGNTTGPLAVSVDPSGLAPGTYNGTVSVTSALANSTPQTIPVVLKVTNDPNIQTNVDSLTFPYQLNQAAPPAQTLNISSTTGVPLNYTATASTSSCGNTWLQFTNINNPASGNTSNSGSIQVAVNTTGLTAGTCNGQIVITGTVASTGATVSSKTIPVTLLVTTTPQLLVTPTSLTFSAPVNAPSPAAQTIALSSTSPAAADVLNYTVTANGSFNGTQWLLAGSSGTTSSGTLPVSVFSSTLPAGTYTGTLTITATTQANVAVANSPITIPVTLQVTSGSLTLSNTQLNFTYTVGAASPATQTVTVGSSTNQNLVYTAVATSSASNPWLTVTPASGNTSGSGTLTIGVDGTKLTAPGTYNGSVTVTSPGAGNSPATINVQVVVTAGSIAASPNTTLSFSQIAGGPAPATQTINVTTSPSGLPFTASATTATGGNWLSVSPTSGNAPGALTVTVNGSGLTAGQQYTVTVTIASSGATGSPINVPVVLTVIPSTGVTVSNSSLTFNYTIGLTPPANQTITVNSTPSGQQVTATITSTSPWLTVTPGAVTTPGTLTVGVNTAGLQAGTQTGTITLNSPNLITPVTVTVTLNAQSVPKPVITSIGNAGSYAGGAISPGENIVIFGTGIGPTPLAQNGVTNNAFGTTVGNTRVLFDGVAAPIIYASATQTSVMVPYGVFGRTATNVVVEYAGVQSVPVSMNVANAAPGIYTLNQAGTGPGAIINQDGVTVNGPNAPEKRGNIISVYMTGEGQTNPAGQDGVIIPPVLSALKTPQLPVTATIGGVSATVIYAGSAASLVSGVMQVNLQIPATVTPGSNVPIVISVGGTPSQTGVTVAVSQ
jgi:uncharacterized protein (TIGR03437 family)